MSSWLNFTEKDPENRLFFVFDFHNFGYHRNIALSQGRFDSWMEFSGIFPNIRIEEKKYILRRYMEIRNFDEKMAVKVDEAGKALEAFSKEAKAFEFFSPTRGEVKRKAKDFRAYSNRQHNHKGRGRRK